MAFGFSDFVLNLICAWFHCNHDNELSQVNGDNNSNSQNLHKPLAWNFDARFLNETNKDAVAFTKLGPVQGYKMGIGDNRQIYAFTGIPYGEPPQRFRDPVPKRPWSGTWQAMSPSPFCSQPIFTLKGSVHGQEDCLHLDIYAPYLPHRHNWNATRRPLLPVIVFAPTGANLYSGSESYGPAYFLREDVIFVPINMRLGIFGYLNTGDSASPGNYGLKDQSLAIKWVYENIDAFGGDPERIVAGGISSGGITSQLMLFSKHKSKKYIKGILAISGSAISNVALDAVGRVRKASNFVAESVGCPTSENGNSIEMVDCLRKVDADFLSFRQLKVLSQMPFLSRLLGPTLEPDLPNAFITELPEVQYQRGIVPPVPMIFSRTQDEVDVFLRVLRHTHLLPLHLRNWYTWMPEVLQLGYHGARERNVSFDEGQRSLLKLTNFYFNEDTPPWFGMEKNFKGFVNMISDSLFNVPMWKSVELHHRIAPTFVYLQGHDTYSASNAPELYGIIRKSMDFRSSHVADAVLLVNNSILFQPLSKHPDFETASRNLINMIASFATCGKPLYRTHTGKIVEVWRPVKDMKTMAVLEVGLVHNIKMIVDPMRDTGRLQIWDEVAF